MRWHNVTIRHEAAGNTMICVGKNVFHELRFTPKFVVIQWEPATGHLGLWLSDSKKKIFGTPALAFQPRARRVVVSSTFGLPTGKFYANVSPDRSVIQCTLPRASSKSKLVYIGKRMPVCQVSISPNGIWNPVVRINSACVGDSKASSVRVLRSTPTHLSFTLQKNWVLVPSLARSNLYKIGGGSQRFVLTYHQLSRQGHPHLPFGKYVAERKLRADGSVQILVKADKQVTPPQRADHNFRRAAKELLATSTFDKIVARSEALARSAKR